MCSFLAILTHSFNSLLPIFQYTHEDLCGLQQSFSAYMKEQSTVNVKFIIFIVIFKLYSPYLFAIYPILCQLLLLIFSVWLMSLLKILGSFLTSFSSSLIYKIIFLSATDSTPTVSLPYVHITFWPLKISINILMKFSIA